METNQTKPNTDSKHDTMNKKETNDPHQIGNRLPVYNLIILDKSGSMHSIRREAVDAYNETLGTIKAAQQKYPDTQEHFISLAAFCSCGIEMIYDKVPALEAEPMNYNRYQPCCCTPLFDAVGSTMSKLKSHAEKGGDYNALVTIITDGYENDSKEWTGKQVKTLIEECRKDGWMVSFIGAMEDAERVAMSISIENVIRWEQTHEGTRQMSKTESDSRSRYFAHLNNNIMCCMDDDMSIEERKASRQKISENYYKDEENSNDKA